MSVTDHTPRPIDPPTQPAKPAGQSQLRWRKVFAIVVPVVILAVAVLAVLRFADVDTLAAYLSRPPLAPAKGVVLFKGEPLKNGQIVTKPDNGRGVSAMGWTDDEGRFTLTTDIRGQRVDGATVGEHRVAVSAYQLIAGPASPPLLTPQPYASVSTTPLRIVVGRNGAANEFELVLEGDAPTRATGAKGQGKGKGGGKGKGKGGPKGSSGGARPQPEPPSEPPSEAVPAEPLPTETPPAPPADEKPADEKPGADATEAP